VLTALILDPIWPKAANLFQERGLGVVLRDQETTASTVNFVILRSSSTLNAQRLETLKHKGLQAVLRAGSGLDNIDLGYCAAHGIEVKNFPGRNADSVAEVTLSYMLSTAHRLYPANAEMRLGIFGKDKYVGRNLKYCRVAFVGYGAIARATVDLLRSLGVEDMRAARKSAWKHGPGDVRLVSLRECFDADITSINVPLDETTRFMINDSLLAGATKGLYLINVSRRDVVDHEALTRHLSSGHIAGYACDVLEPTKDKSLINHPNVFATPHLGAQSVDCQRVIAYEILECMLGWHAKMK
jgi:D-3-phosphoglycerate dehydrogenase